MKSLLLWGGERINNRLRRIYNWYNRKRLRNLNITLISSNCTGAAILHDLNLRFNSPFVNLWLNAQDFLKMCENLDFYLKQDIVFIKDKDVDYPVGRLYDISIYFQHYSDEKEARETWERRKKRMNMNNLFIMFTDRDGCTYEDLQQFDQLPYNKVVYVHKSSPKILSACYVPGFENDESVGQLLSYKNRYTWKKYYDAFDYVKWFNKKHTHYSFPHQL